MSLQIKILSYPQIGKSSFMGIVYAERTSTETINMVFKGDGGGIDIDRRGKIGRIQGGGYPLWPKSCHSADKRARIRPNPLSGSPE